MKHLVDFIIEDGEAVGIAPPMGALISGNKMATPGNTMGMGNPKPPTAEEPGSGDMLGKTHSLRKRKRRR